MIAANMKDPMIVGRTPAKWAIMPLNAIASGESPSYMVAWMPNTFPLFSWETVTCITVWVMTLMMLLQIPAKKAVTMITPKLLVKPAMSMQTIIR